MTVSQDNSDLRASHLLQHQIQQLAYQGYVWTTGYSDTATGDQELAVVSKINSL